MPKLFIVDDDRELVRLFSSFFKGEGWDVASAYGGEEAMAALDPSFDAVVLDLWMETRTEGEETLKRIRQRHDLDHVCVVVLTAHAAVESAVRTLRNGAYQYLVKDIEMPELQRVLMGGIAHHKTASLRKQILGTLQVEQILAHVQNILTDTFRPDCASLLVLSKGGTPRSVEVSGSEARDVATRRFAKIVMTTGEPILADLSTGDVSLEALLSDARSLLATPIPGDAGTHIGVLAMESRKQKAFDRSWQDVLVELAELAGIAIHIADRAEEKRRRLLTEKTEMVRDLGHQILTPLQVIRMQIDTLRHKELARPELPRNLGDAILRRVEVMENNTEAVVQVCKNLADISRKLPLQKVPTDMAALLNKRIREDYAECQAKQIQLRLVRKAQNAMVALVDPTAIQYCLQCLIRNSIEAIDRRRLAEAADVSIATEAADSSKPILNCITLALSEQGVARDICIGVSDTGTGVQLEEQQRIFEPFYTTKGRANLNGTGLFSVKRIVAEHGGSVGITSDGGRGATVTICLPRKATE